MAESHLISGLVAKHSELAGEIQSYRQRISEAKASLDTIGAAIKVIEPDFNLTTIKSKIKKPQNRYFKARESYKLLLECFRDAQGEISSRDLFAGVALKKGLDLDSMEPSEVKYFKMTLHTTLKRMQQSEIIKESGRNGTVIIWELLSSLSD